MSTLWKDSPNGRRYMKRRRVKIVLGTILLPVLIVMHVIVETGVFLKEWWSLAWHGWKTP